MSDVSHSTNMQWKMDDDFVSHKGDYDFPLYLSEKEEWVHLKNIKGRIILSEPFLIMELNRFVPYLENNKVKFHPLNMPYVKIGKIEIVGFVVYVSEDSRFYEYRGNTNSYKYYCDLSQKLIPNFCSLNIVVVDDGTGTISIFYDKKYFALTIQQRQKIDEKYESSACMIDVNQLKIQDCPGNFPKPRPNFSYPAGTSIRDMAIFEHNWAIETNNGSLGKKIERCKYVHAVGYCSLDFMYGQRPRDEIKFTDLSLAKINFFATKVTCISEHEYNSKLLSWFNNVVRRRYDEHVTEPKTVIKGND